MFKGIIFLILLLLVPFFTSAQTRNLVQNDKKNNTVAKTWSLVQNDKKNYTVPIENSITSPGGLVMVHYDSGNAGLLGHNGITFIGGARFRANIMEAYSNDTLQFVQFYYVQKATGLTIKIYDAGNDTHPGTLLLNQPLALASLKSNNWNEIKLNSGIPISGNDLWVCLQVEDSTGTNAPYGISKFQDPDGDWTVDTSGVWEHLNDLGYPVNWNIRAVIKSTLLAGDYTIGAAGDFSTISAAFLALSTYGIAAPVTFELIDDIYTAPATGTGYTLVGPITGADKNNRITIRPAVNKNVTIEGRGGRVFYFVDVSYLTIKGIALTGRNTLTIHSIYNNQYGRNEAVLFYGKSGNNELKNITVINDDYTRGAPAIGIYGNAANQTVPDSNVIENNAVTGGSFGIVIHGSSSSLKSTGNVVKGNHIGSESDSLTTIGMEFKYTKRTLIEKNEIQNLRYNWSRAPDTHGMFFQYSDSTIIRNNVIHNVYDANGPYGSLGIILESGSGNLIYNNMIYDIRSSGSSGYLTALLLHQEHKPEIYYNSFYLYGKGDGTTGSTDLFIQSGCDSIYLKNNILVNTRVDSPERTSLINDYFITNITSDHNDLYCLQNPDHFLVESNDSSYATLNYWQGKGQDLNSISEMPPFISPYLHIDATQTENLDGHAVPIAGITTDFDYDTRDPNTPDIGADEFIAPEILKTSQFTQLRRYQLEQNYPNPFNPSTKINYSLPKAANVTIKVYDVIGEEVAVLVNSYKAAGNYQAVFNASNLPSGIYFYRLKAGNYTSVKKMILLK